MKQDMIFKNIFRLITVVITLLLILFVIYGLKLGIFQDKNVLVDYIKEFGVVGPLFFIFLQLFQVVFPIVPGGASCLAGVLAFGPVLGFIYNYIGLVLGSITVYFLSRKYGIKLIKRLFGEDRTYKYLRYVRGNSFDKIFVLGIFIPGLPDDLLCYIAGLSDLGFRKFLLIILLGKPLALLMYSLFMMAL